MDVIDQQDLVATVEVYVVDLRQDQPYLGSLREGETVNAHGYFVRQGNRTVYPLANRSLVVRLVTQGGVEGWGETYGLVAPRATAAIINDLLIGFVIDRDPADPESLHDQLYDLMRVRGYTGGFYLDALAAIDIALWDIAGKQSGQSVAALLGGRKQQTIPAYVSGLPADSLPERCELAKDWQRRGFNSFKFALPVADDGAVKELKALRQALGSDAEIACDLHWSLSVAEAIESAREMSDDRPWFLEAPVIPEDVEGLCEVTRNSGQSIAVGEEWRTVHDARMRVDRKGCHIVQPEMGHTGITQFMRIGRLTQSQQLQIIPHATIGAGVFLAASLQASAALGRVVSHEFQHSVFQSFRHFTGDALSCEHGEYRFPDSPGIGVAPTPEMLAKMELIPA